MANQTELSEQDILKICQKHECVFVKANENGENYCSKRQDLAKVLTDEGCPESAIRNPEKVGFSEIKTGSLNTNGFRYDLLPGYVPIDAE
ncbi:MAG: hypothetical protein WC784_00095 [Candidatus Shapirobacteria bacterium]|jgi:hypothetical protein